MKTNKKTKRCAQFLSETQNTTWLLATDNAIVRQKWRNLLGNRVISVENRFEKKNDENRKMINKWKKKQINLNKN